MADQIEFDGRVRTMQIIAGTMISAVMIFLIIAFFIRGQGNMQQPPPIPMIMYVGLAFGGMILITHFVMEQVMAAQGRRKLDLPSVDEIDSIGEPDTDWVALYQSRLIVACAMLEGAAMFLTVSYFLEGEVLSLIGAIILIAVLASKFPTAARIKQWIATQQGLAHRERMRVG